ncbi:bacillithiol system redox-active protein YtxJ [Taibaiella lutea]|uniref:Bacillithiol system redox-active protein YtxJ n=1 Tax=Taibaiella lutea TaxID=2608001 RepID=A0A5M6CBG4_9BACT|nr:bacillithiol system redox-active protein YtxJ [Taibaiella lutea]KAA5532538.1 bacillithiol system redox-active protein YtxJ [Taibaiella lutea]
MQNWKQITSEEDVNKIIEASEIKPQLIFKDSLTCGISAHAKERLKDGYHLMEGKADLHYLDLLQYRSVSGYIAQTLGLTHQSPQIIILKNRKVAYSSSHHAINSAEIVKYL